jgi:hypothetical protein
MQMGGIAMNTEAADENASSPDVRAGTALLTDTIEVRV